MIFFFREGRPVYGVVRKFKCPLKKTQPFCPCSRAVNWTGKGLSSVPLRHVGIVPGIHDLSTRLRLHLCHLPHWSPPIPVDRRLDKQQYEHEDSAYQYSLFIFTFFISVSVIKFLQMLIFLFSKIDSCLVYGVESLLLFFHQSLFPYGSPSVHLF